MIPSIQSSQGPASLAATTDVTSIDNCQQTIIDVTRSMQPGMDRTNKVLQRNAALVVLQHSHILSHEVKINNHDIYRPTRRSVRLMRIKVCMHDAEGDKCKQVGIINCIAQLAM